MAKTQPVPCVVREGGLGEEDSLAENVQRIALHRSTSFRAFQTLRERGLSEEEIAARFFVNPTVVKQRLKLAAVSDKLPRRLCRGRHDAGAADGVHGHQRPCAPGAGLGVARLAPTTRSRITSAASLPKARFAPPTSARGFVGVDTYEAAGGVVLRDLFQHDDGGWAPDPALLDRLVIEKLQAEAETLRATAGSGSRSRPTSPMGTPPACAA